MSKDNQNVPNYKGKPVKAKRLGDLQKVSNQKPKFGANLEYNYIRVQFADGSEVNLLFTDNEIKRAQERAAKNPEDLPKVSLFRDIWD